VIRYEPSCCAGRDRDLAGAAEAGVIRRQVTDIPPVKAEITEHQMIGRRCSCGTVTWGRRRRGDRPGEVRAAALGVYLWPGQFLSRDRACRTMAEMFGCAPSPRRARRDDQEDRRDNRPVPGGRRQSSRPG